MGLSTIKEQLHNRLPELSILLLMLILVGINLSVFLQVDIWRQDSMYYVSGYGDKLSEEGRWINYLFFKFLRIFPSDLAILISYASIAGFAYSIAIKVTNSRYLSLTFGILCVLVPVLPVQLQWPETLLFGFIFLALSPRLQQFLPSYYFFPIMGILFFGTFSAFYFLMPLLFLHNLRFNLFLRLMAYWIGGFIFAYIMTQVIVWSFTGNTIQIAGWRQPHPATDFSSLLENIGRVTASFLDHWSKAQVFLKSGVVAILALIAITVAIIKKQYFTPIIGVISGLGIYVSVIPIGIYIQERTTLSVFIALFAALFIYNYQSRKAKVTVMAIMALLSIRLASISHEEISWYKSWNEILLRQFSSAINHYPEEVNRVFIAAESPEILTVFRAINPRIRSKSFLSEDFTPPLYWVPSLKHLGFTHFRVCLDLQGWDCEQIVDHYKQRYNLKRDSGLFVSQRLPSGDLLIMLNPQANE